MTGYRRTPAPVHDHNHKLRSNLLAHALWALLLCAPGPGIAQRLERDGALLDGVPATALAGLAPLDRYQQTRQARLLEWLSDGSLLIGSEDPLGLKPERVQEPLAARATVAASTVRVRSCSAQPYVAGWFACLEPDAASSGAALVLHDLGSSAARTLAAASEQASAPQWAHDGVRLAFVRTVAGGAEEIAALESPEAAAQPQLDLPGTGWNLLGWSADDHLLLLRRELADGTAELALANLTDHVVLPLEPAESNTRAHGARRARAADTPALQISAARFSADGRGIYFISDQDGAAGHLHYQEFSGAQARDLTPGLNAAVEGFDVSADGHYLAYVYREEGISRVALIDQRAGVTTLLTGVPAGLISTLRFNRAGDALGLTAESGDAPAEVYVYTLASHVTTRWTANGSESLVAGVRIHYPTWEHGGREVGATFYRPTVPGRHPVLVLLRESELGNPAHYDGFVQYLVNERHVAVLALEFSPSRAPPESNAADEHQQNQIRDLGALLAWAGLQPDLDRDHMAVVGQGASAPLALAALSQYAERFRAAVCIDGVFAPTAPLPETEGAVLLLNGLSDPLPAGAAGEPLLWRLRAAHDAVWYLGLPGPTPAGRELAWRVESAFLATYLAE
jgi:dienelactone hydrolase